MNRREFTKAALGASTLGMTAIAGCAGSDEPDDADTGDTGDSDTSTQETGSADSTDSQQTQEQTQTQEQSDGSGLELLSHEWYEEDYSAGVRGSAVNNTGDELASVWIEVIFLDADGAQIEEGLDSTTDLPDGREWKFDAAYLGTDSSVVEDYEIEISDMPF